MPSASRGLPRPVGLSPPQLQPVSVRFERPGWPCGYQPQRAYPLSLQLPRTAAACPALGAFSSGTVAGRACVQAEAPQRLTLLACPRNSQRTHSERSGRGPQRLTILTALALWGVAALAVCAVARPCSVPPRGPSSATGNRAGHASARPLRLTSPWAPLERWQRAVCPLRVCLARRPAQGRSSRFLRSLSVAPM